jgi:copper chaperone CopZ
MKQTSIWFTSALLAFVVTLGQWAYAGEGHKIDLQITGMKCSGCEAKVKASLSEIKGVVSTQEVSASKGSATVTIDKAVISEEQLVEALASKTGYKVAVMKNGAKVSAEGHPAGCCAKGQANPACKSGDAAKCSKKGTPGKCAKD